MAEEVTETHEQQIADLMRIGLTRVQAERELAARAGEDVSDIAGEPHSPAA